MSKTKTELLAQPTLDAGEARALSRLLGRGMELAWIGRLCRDGKIQAEKRGSRWYIDRASWVAYLETPTPTGAAAHKKAGKPAWE